jgi:hypothetical protein
MIMDDILLMICEFELCQGKALSTMATRDVNVSCWESL